MLHNCFVCTELSIHTFLLGASCETCQDLNFIDASYFSVLLKMISIALYGEYELQIPAARSQ